MEGNGGIVYMSALAERPAPGGQWFETTHWSVVRTAAGMHSPESVAALENLCRTYGPPLYAFLRRLQAEMEG
jgi:hypothetical protein